MIPKINHSKQEQITNVLLRYKKKLLLFDKVSDLGVGYKFVNNELTNEMAIIVEVEEKLAPEQLDIEQLLPREIEGIPVDVVISQQTEIFREEDDTHPEIQKISERRDQYFDQLIGGIAIKNANLSDLGGTLGAVVFDQNSGNPYGITCRHVLTKDKLLSIRKTASVIQPTSGSKAGATIGKAFLKNKLPLDCIRFKLNGKRNFDVQQSVLGLSGKINGITNVIDLGTKVMKSGARTGVTHGVIVATSICFNRFIIYPDEAYQLIDGELSMAGDSGAIWITNDKHQQAIGLHCLGNRRKGIDLECSMAINMDRVAKYLKIRF